MDYGLKLRELREMNGRSQLNMAKALGVARITYCHWEVQEKIVPLEKLNEICNFFNVSLDYVFNLTDTPLYKDYKTDINRDLSKIRLKEFRKENKLTQVKLANILNIGHGTIAEFERGRYLISTHVLYAICKKYKISADYLLGKVDSPKYLK